MNSTDSVFQRATETLLKEVFEGAPAEGAFILNPGDQGLLGQLETLDAATASLRPMPGRTTIAAHVDHVRYGIELLNRWAEGEANPWATADWEASWRRTSVSESEWRALRDSLRSAAEKWRQFVAERSEWEDLAAAGAIASFGHTAYHLGAIRQILAATGTYQG